MVFIKPDAFQCEIKMDPVSGSPTIDDAVASSASTCIVLDVVEDRLVIAYASQGFLDFTGSAPTPPSLLCHEREAWFGPLPKNKAGRGVFIISTASASTRPWVGS